ncbi:MAG: hypothetical protein VZR27_05165 [Acutalibacteraceae bacterium]|nr:hypothetical protein [Acutalibacteraceae bacterium]
MKRQKSNKKQNRSSLKLMIISLGLLIILLTVTLAMFTSGDFVSNRFSGGKVDISLIEPDWQYENGMNVIPGDIIPKNPGVVNNEKLDVYVFLKVTVPCDTDLVIENDQGEDKGKPLSAVYPVPLYKFIDKDDQMNTDLNSTQQVNAEWVLIYGYPVTNTDNTEYTYVYGYIGSNQNPKRLEALSENQKTTQPLFNKIQVLNFGEKGFDSERSYGITVKAYGIQTQFLNGDLTTNIPDEVWAKIGD